MVKYHVHKLAEEHVDWFVNVLRHLIDTDVRKWLKDEFIHGYKHGYDDAHDESKDEML